MMGFGVCVGRQSQFCARKDGPEGVSQPKLVQPSLGTSAMPLLLLLLSLPATASVKRPNVISLRMLRARMSRNDNPDPWAMPLISSI